METEKDFKSLNEVKRIMQETDSTDNFEAVGHMLILANKKLRLWILSTKQNIYFVLDDKENIRKIYSSPKKNFGFDILKKERPLYGEILFSDAKKPIPFDKGLTGDTSVFEAKLKTLIDEHA